VTRYKARLVAQGFNQVPGSDFDETWAPVPSSATTRALFAVAEAKDWEIHHVDVNTAFLNAKMDKEVHRRLPDGTEPGEADVVFRLNLALYGTKQAGRLKGIKLDKELKAIGAVRSKVDPCLYTWSHPVHGLVYILVYVDDLIVAGKGLDGVQAVKNVVSATLDVRDMGEVKDFIGMKVMRDREAKVIILSNPGHFIALLEAFQMDKSAPNKTPMVPGAKLAKTGENLLPDGNRYAKLVGSLLYLSTTTRPDSAFAVGVLSHYMACPEEDHMRAAKGLLRYLRGATRLGVAYAPTSLSKGTSTPSGRETLTLVGRRQVSSLPSTAGRSRGGASASRRRRRRRLRPSTWPPRWRPRRPFGSKSFYRRLASTAAPFPWGKTTRRA